MKCYNHDFNDPSTVTTVWSCDGETDPVPVGDKVMVVDCCPYAEATVLEDKGLHEFSHRDNAPYRILKVQIHHETMGVMDCTELGCGNEEYQEHTKNCKRPKDQADNHSFKCSWHDMHVSHWRVEE